MKRYTNVRSDITLPCTRECGSAELCRAVCDEAPSVIFLSRAIREADILQVVYVTAVVPYIVLIVLLVWNVQLDGAWLGIQFYLIPEWSKLSSAKVR